MSDVVWVGTSASLLQVMGIYHAFPEFTDFKAMGSLKGFTFCFNKGKKGDNMHCVPEKSSSHVVSVSPASPHCTFQPLRVLDIG